MKMFNKMLKVFLKSPQIIIMYILIIAISNIYMYKLMSDFITEYLAMGNKATDTIFFFDDIRYICILFFVGFFFIAFEFARKMIDIKEILNAFGQRSIIPYVNQIIILVLGALMLTLNIAVYAVITYMNLNCEEYIFDQMLKVLFYDVFFVSLASAGAGLLISKFRRKLIGYTIFLIWTLLLVPDYYAFLRAIFKYGREIFKGIYNLLCFLPQDVNYTVDTLYGLPFERYRLFCMLFWIVLGIVVHIGACCIKRKRFITYPGVVAALVLLVLSFDKGSVLRMDDEMWEVTTYYEENNTQIKQVDYRVTEYTIDFEIANELSAVCKLKLGGDIDQKQYYFTLYHGYKVKKVQNERGQLLHFSQDGDYITIYSDKPEKSIIINYKGNGGIFYSNDNASFLPGFFPYYPKAGFVEICDDNFVFTAGKDEKTKFNVGIVGAHDYVVNLPEKDSRYQGNIENLTIVGGNYELHKDGKKQYVILPMQKSSYALMDYCKKGKLQKELDELMEYLGGENMHILDSSFFAVIPNSTAFATHLEGAYVTDSCVLVGDQTSAYSVLKERIGTGEDGSLKYVFFELEPNADFELKSVVHFNKILDDKDYTVKEKLHDAVLDKMKSVGVQKTTRKIYRYITSDRYNENLEEQLAFVESIK